MPEAGSVICLKCQMTYVPIPTTDDYGCCPHCGDIHTKICMCKRAYPMELDRCPACDKPNKPEYQYNPISEDQLREKLDKVYKGTIPFNRDDVLAYLDNNIRYWREKREPCSRSLQDLNDAVIASYYIDAYQSMRVSLFGETLD